MGQFVFALCAPGAEGALKREVEARRLGWSSSYQRPGFVTFRADDDDLGPLPELTWARARSHSLGRLPAPWTREAISALLGDVDVLRVSGRDPSVDPQVEALTQALGAADAPVPRDGQRVGELVVVTPEELYVGAHVHDETHARRAGGIWPLVVPDAAPSRAWAKLEAVLDWWGHAPAAGQHVLELGSAPGGAAWALLERGARVTGVDPAAMDPRVLAHPRYRHVGGSISVLPISALPTRVDWLVSDMNVTPRLTLRSAERFLQAEGKGGPRALVLTLKLKDWALAEQVPTWLDTVASWGFEQVLAQQLWPHRQELAIVARRGM